jgi:serpin B
VNALVAASNAFALDLYARLRESEGNLFFSPYSISTALAMTSAGARGKTLDEMGRVLHLPAQSALHPAAAALSADMLRRAGKNVELSVANALWVQKGKHFREEFLSLTRTYYGAGCQQVDFIGGADSARRTINDWTERQTRQRIHELLAPGNISPLTRLVLTNAVYFKAKWEKEFDKSDTRDEDFHLSGGGKVKKPLMHQTDQFDYGEAEGLQVLSMPYAGGDFSMVILLPGKKSTLANLEAAMTKNLNKWLAGLSWEKVIVTVPRFEMTAQRSMKDVLSQMGMSRAFSANAEFGGINDDSLQIGAVIHKAFVEVSEKGTEAAAVTAVEMAVGAPSPVVPQLPPVDFTADRPFVYLIRDTHTGTILFMGRYVGK